MKILFVTESFPYPLNTGGKIRTFHVLKGLCSAHEVVFVSNYEPHVDEINFHAVEELVSDFHVVPHNKKNSLALGLKVLWSLFSNIPIVVSRHYNPQMKKKIASLKQQEFDAGHFDHLDSSIYLECIEDGVKLFLDQHNVVTNQIKSSLAVESNWLKKIYMMLQARKTKQYEENTCSRMNRCFVCSDADKAYLLEISPDASLEVIPNGVDVEYFSSLPKNVPEKCSHLSKGKTVIFVGTLDYGPGEMAVKYFCNEILPILHKKDPDICFIAVGQNPPAFLNRMADRDNRILVTGRVSDIRPYVASALIFVVPLLSGSGTRLKILDAMSMQIPIVSTSIGAEGLETVSGINILIADEPQHFAESVLNLMESKTLQEKLKSNAYSLVSERYSWRTIWGYLLSHYAL